MNTRSEMRKHTRMYSVDLVSSREHKTGDNDNLSIESELET